MGAWGQQIVPAPDGFSVHYEVCALRYFVHIYSVHNTAYRVCSAPFMGTERSEAWLKPVGKKLPLI